MSLQTLNFNVTLPATRTDGTVLPVSEIASVSIFQRISTGTYIGLVQTVTPDQLPLVKSVEMNNGEVFTATVRDTAGNDSEASAEVVVNVVQPPSAPGLDVS